jgi:RNA polymerase sigma-70 factor (sigma-E family)
MNDTAVFDEFVRDRAPHLLRLAQLLTRDHGHAEDLLQTALVRSWSAWRRIAGDPEPYVRQVLVNTYASWRGRRWHGERPSAVLPEPPGAVPHTAVDDRDQVWRALDRLPRRQRAVLVLRYFEDLPEARIADTLGMPVGSVKSTAARALAALRLDGSLRPEGALAVVDVIDGPPSGDRVAAVHARIERRRRHRIATAATAAAVVLAVVVAYAFGSHLNLFGAREPLGPGTGSYRDGYRIVAQADGTAQHPPTVTWVPTTTDAKIFVSCSIPGNPVHAAWTAMAYIGDHPVSDSYDCPSTGSPAVAGVPIGGNSLAAAGVRQGVPSVVTVRVLPVMPAGSTPPGTSPPDAPISLAIGEAASFDEYPLPPRPHTLTPLDRSTLDQNRLLALYGPGAPATAPVAASGYVAVYISAQTPGFVEISVGGGPAQTVKFWDYGVSELINIDLGQHSGPVAVTVTTEHMTGDWFVGISREA